MCKVKNNTKANLQLTDNPSPAALPIEVADSCWFLFFLLVEPLPLQGTMPC